MENVRAHVWISGRVQGVFFRSGACKQADALHVNGWVKNCPNGQVEAVFEGEKAAVEKIVAWCHHGPAYANVEKVTVIWEEYRNEFSGFNVRG